MSGGRLDLHLEAKSASSTRYRAELSAGSQSWHGSIEISAEGAVSLEFPADPPAWLSQATIAILRAESRSDTPWPRRITRWRKAPEP